MHVLAIVWHPNARWHDLDRDGQLQYLKSLDAYINAGRAAGAIVLGWSKIDQTLPKDRKKDSLVSSDWTAPNRFTSSKKSLSKRTGTSISTLLTSASSLSAQPNRSPTRYTRKYWVFRNGDSKKYNTIPSSP